MTSREIRKFMEEIQPSPGYVLDLGKNELADLVYDLTGLELEDYEQNGISNGKRLVTFLSSASEEQQAVVVAKLRELKE